MKPASSVGEPAVLREIKREHYSQKNLPNNYPSLSQGSKPGKVLITAFVEARKTACVKSRHKLKLRPKLAAERDILEGVADNKSLKIK